MAPTGFKAMLFNSWSFIFLFLPIFLFLWEGTARLAPPLLPVLFLCASVIFYALWGLPWLILLFCMIGMNYGLGIVLAANAERPEKIATRRHILAISILLNILPLIWFKYSWFIIENLALLFHSEWQFTPPALPLGISFYTFIQIAWLVGVYRGMFRPSSFWQHALFSCAFPYIISGPIVRYDQIGSQLKNVSGLNAGNLSRGFTLFCMGLAKKAIIADSIGFYANAIFNAAEKNWPISCAEAWLGSLCYTFQLYFDFSGYTDMALGIGIMLGLRLPENFNSPYKATGIVDFWRRWHITLGAWLRDFLYIPLGGNRKGKLCQYRNLFLTMLIGGAWHGAGWTFMLWGALHGFMLCINHFWRTSIPTSLVNRLEHGPFYRGLAILLTFFCVNLVWVVFRADSLDAALALYQTMFTYPFIPAETVASNTSDYFGQILPNHYFTGWQPVGLLLICVFLCWGCPNSTQILSGRHTQFFWRPSRSWAICMAMLAFLSLTLLSRQSTFLYFKF